MSIKQFRLSAQSPILLRCRDRVKIWIGAVVYGGSEFESAFSQDSLERVAMGLESIRPWGRARAKLASAMKPINLPP
jgi:hypothetical protein